MVSKEERERELKEAFDYFNNLYSWWVMDASDDNKKQCELTLTKVIEKFVNELSEEDKKVWEELKNRLPESWVSKKVI